MLKLLLTEIKVSHKYLARYKALKIVCMFE
jgi:hypothetical protein